MGEDVRKTILHADTNRYKTIRADLNFNHRIDGPNEQLGATEALIESAIKAANIIDSYVLNGHQTMPDIKDPTQQVEIRLKPGQDGRLNYGLIRAMAEANIRAAGYNIGAVREELVAGPLKDIERIQAETFAKLTAASH
ncbi:MAG: hypothetical protein U1E36_06740 [Rickettsiales bacterium]